MTTTITIVGAGMAGLLAANMLKHRKPLVLEAQAELPNNHSAVLRFRTDAVGRELGIIFKPVTMIKTYQPWLNPVADALAYSFKCTGMRRSDRSISEGSVKEERFIAPPDLIYRASRGVDVSYDSRMDFTQEGNGRPAPIISTIPMPELMKALVYPHVIPFKYHRGVNVRATIDHCDAYVSLLVPDPEKPYSRISITGSEMIVECPGGTDANPIHIAALAANDIGIAPAAISQVTQHSSRYAKILPIDEAARQDFIWWATDRYNIFSLGRFSTWRPGLLLDSLVHDIRLIDHWIDRRYALGKNRQA